MPVATLSSSQCNYPKKFLIKSERGEMNAREKQSADRIRSYGADNPRARAREASNQRVHPIFLRMCVYIYINFFFFRESLTRAVYIYNHACREKERKREMYIERKTTTATATAACVWIKIEAFASSAVCIYVFTRPRKVWLARSSRHAARTAAIWMEQNFRARWNRNARKA